MEILGGKRRRRKIWGGGKWLKMGGIRSILGGIDPPHNLKVWEGSFSILPIFSDYGGGKFPSRFPPKTWGGGWDTLTTCSTPQCSGTVKTWLVQQWLVGIMLVSREIFLFFFLNIFSRTGKKKFFFSSFGKKVFLPELGKKVFFPVLEKNLKILIFWFLKKNHEIFEKIKKSKHIYLFLHQNYLLSNVM